jgi:Domain of unknown function (DUF4430)
MAAPPARKCLGLWLGFGLALLALASPLARADDKAKTVKVVIDYGDGVQKVFPALEWKEGMTALDALDKAKAPAHGITFKYTGKGDTAFLTQIDDLKNEGGGKDKKNWLFWVNDAMADKSFGAWKLEKGDVVLWKFAVYEGK